MRWKSFCFHWWRGIGSRTLMIFKHYLCTNLISESFHCNAIFIYSLIISPSLYILVKLHEVHFHIFYYCILFTLSINTTRLIQAWSTKTLKHINCVAVYLIISTKSMNCTGHCNAQMYDKNDNYSKILVLKIFDDSNIRATPKELLVRSPNKSTKWFEFIHLPHSFVKKFLSVTNKSKFLSTLRSITIIWLRWNIHDVLLPFVFVLTFFRASSAKEKHVASAFLQSTKPKLSQLFDIFDTKATKKTETTISTSACRFSTRKTYA